MELPVDSALIISITALAASLITLWLTELRGPNITMVGDPEFIVNDDSFAYLLSGAVYNYTPFWFTLTPVSFLFANYGGKDGTILNVTADFTPANEFSDFGTFCANIPFHIVEAQESSLPITVKEGSNRYIKFSPRMETIRWKETALAEAVDKKLMISKTSELAMTNSKEYFRNFCDFLENHKELGVVNCTITLTSGRFRTKIKTKSINKNFQVKNRCKESLIQLRCCLLRWDELSPTRAELEDKLLQATKMLIKEITHDFSSLSEKIDEHQISLYGNSAKLQVDYWQSLQNIQDQQERKIRLCLVKRSKSIEDDLVKFYSNAAEYNLLFDQLVVLGKNRSEDDFITLNTLREKLKDNAYRIMDDLETLQKTNI